MNSSAQTQQAGSSHPPRGDRRSRSGAIRRAVAIASSALPARWSAAGVVAAVALSLAPPAAAQSTSAQARTLFREARALMDKGRHAQACPKLEESLRLDHGIGTQFNLAHCWEKVGRTASAWGLFMDVATAAATAGQSKRAKAAEQRAAELEPTLMRLVIEVPKPSPSMTVQRSGKDVGAAAWGTAMPVDPGAHRVEASAPGKLPWSKEVQLIAPGETVTLVVPALEDSEPSAPEPSVQARPEADEPVGHDRGASRGWRTAGTIALAVVGVGGVVTGTVFAVSANDQTAAARELCTGGPERNVCNRGSNLPGFDGGAREQEELLEHRDRAESAAVLSYVAAGVGVAALAGSAILLFTAPSTEREPEAAALELSPTLAPGVAGVRLDGTF